MVKGAKKDKDEIEKRKIKVLAKIKEMKEQGVKIEQLFTKNELKEMGI